MTRLLRPQTWHYKSWDASASGKLASFAREFLPEGFQSALQTMDAAPVSDEASVSALRAA